MTDKKDTKATLGMSRHEDGSIKMDGQSMLASLGGVWGLIESSIPGVAYVAAFAITRSTALSLYIASTLALIFIVAQFVRKRPLAQAVYGLVGVFVTMFLTLRGGDDPNNARDYFLTGFFTNAGYLAALIISILVRWPIIGVLVGVFSNGVQWRKSRSLVRRYSYITCIWIALFALRLIVQVPFYLANQVVILGFLRLFMGVPLYVLCAWLTWMAVRPILRDIV